ncbi:MAG: type II secretion system F family protein [bacterium]
MATFNYEAKDNFGEMRSGTVEAVDEQTAIEALKKHNLIVLSVAEAGKGMSISLSIFDKVKSRDLVTFSRQLATLMEAKVPLVESLRTLSKQTEARFFKGIIYEVTNDVNGGTPFSDALEKHPKAFSKFYVSMIRAGEASGNLQNTLLYLADYLETNFDLMKQVKGAMMYPAFLISAMVLIGILMLVLVIPKLTAVFEEGGQELPLMTRLLMNLSEFMQAYWWLIMLMIAGVVFGLPVLVNKTKQGREVWDKYSIKIPIFGAVLRNIYIARFAENFSVLIAAGIPITRALEMTADIVGNNEYKKLIDEAVKRIKAGDSISSVFERSSLFPALASSMISIGERSGKLDQVLKNVGKAYKRDVDILVTNLTKLIEPILMVVMGIAVAVLVAAILLPMWGMVDVMK